MRRTLLLTTLLLLASRPATAVPPSQEEVDRARLLEGVARITKVGVPGPLCLVSEAAFVVVPGETAKGVLEPIVAAARVGKGRVVAFGHPGYLDSGNAAVADNGHLVLNAIRWAGGQAKVPRIALMGVDGLAGFLRSKIVAVDAIEGGRLDGGHGAEALDHVDVLVLDPAVAADPKRRELIVAFVENGGGLLAGGIGWGWSQLNPDKSLRDDHSGNALFARFGILWGDGYTDEPPGGYPLGKEPPPSANAAVALSRLIDEKRLSPAEIKEVITVVARAARVLPPADKSLRPRIEALRRKPEAQRVPTEGHPIGWDAPLARLALSLDCDEASSTAEGIARAHPSAVAFPGVAPKGAPRATREVEVDAAEPDWHSTGLYAPPGETIEVTVPREAAGRGFRVRIGAHTDAIDDIDRWPRAPRISLDAPLSSTTTRLANSFGGAIYIVVPRASKAGAVKVKIANAIEAPLFVLGKTDLKEWRATIRRRPAPWAELGSSKLILSVPSEVVRDLDNPAALMAFWDRVLDADADLAQRSRERDRPERLACDVEISAGYMHSGYPVMTHMDVSATVVDLKAISDRSHEKSWGFFHELGHNHQSPDWTFDGTGEVTVNLFTHYVLDTVCGLPPREANRGSGEDARKRMRDHVAKGAKFDAWKADPFLALSMYMLLQEAFGWGAFQAVFKTYRDLPEKERPKTDAEKRDQWLVRFSRQVGRNLGPYFEAWGVPTSKAARDSLAGLPGWMPP